MSKAKEYEDLKARIGVLEAQKQFWSGKKEAHDQNRKKLLEQAKGLGIEGSSLEEVSQTLEKEVASKLLELESEVTKAEELFTKLRSEHGTT